MTDGQTEQPAYLRDAANLTQEGENAKLRAEVERLTAAHARCTNLSNAEAARIFDEAGQMRAERDKLSERLATVERERDQWGGKAASAQAESTAFRRQRDEVVKALGDLLDAVTTLTNDDPTHYVVANAVGGPSLVARQLVDLYRRAAALRPEPTP